MRRCLICDAKFSINLDACSECNAIIPMVGELQTYAPDFSEKSAGFEPQYFDELALLEEGNFWFRSRNKVILWVINKYCIKAKSMLEVGCGTGFVLGGVSRARPDIKMFGSELFLEGLGYTSSRVPTATLMQLDARNIPFSEEFDIVGAFDVLEHIQEDTLVLSQIKSSLKQGGYLVLTVPQHQWLWSATDDYARHVRRYDAKDLHEKIENAGFRILKSTSFVSTLLPLMLVSRLLQRRQDPGDFDATAELKIPSLLNKLLESFLHFELLMIRLGVSIPFGGSRLVVAHKGDVN